MTLSLLINHAYFSISFASDHEDNILSDNREVLVMCFVQLGERLSHPSLLELIPPIAAVVYLCTLAI